VYDHFGSKEKLFLALLDEHLSAQIAEQQELFDPAEETASRPLAGADRWMQELEEDPDAFRLFVETWLRGQRDEEVRARIVAGMDAWRETLMGFACSLGHEPSKEFATAMLAIATGLGLIKLADPDSVPPELLGEVYVLMISAAEAVADRSRSPAASA
jgi:AcrR family transcriptional regulator